MGLLGEPMQSPTITSMLNSLCSFVNVMLLLAPTWRTHDLEWVCLSKFTPIRRFSFETEGGWTTFSIYSLLIASSSGPNSKGVLDPIKHDRLCLVPFVASFFVYFFNSMF
jgi:hypothetical protein